MGAPDAEYVRARRGDREQARDRPGDSRGLDAGGDAPRHGARVDAVWPRFGRDCPGERGRSRAGLIEGRLARETGGHRRLPARLRARDRAARSDIRGGGPKEMKIKADTRSSGYQEAGYQVIRESGSVT